MSLRILLLQAREPGDRVREEERQSFAEKANLRLEQVVAHDLLEGPPSMDRIRAFDAVMMGGSGDYYVSRADLPHFAALMDHLREIVARGVPMFASCFGFQCLVEALGGRIAYDPENTEVGTKRLELTAEGMEDPLMGQLPPVFMAQLGRKDRAITLPDGIVNLARSHVNPHQAFRIPDQAIWATQFHPELDARTNKGRYIRYLDGYSAHLSDAQRKAILSEFAESPDTEELLGRYLRLVFG